VRYPLVLLGHRFYDPGAGRFLNRDPQGMEGGINVYAYCTNNPVNHADPLGLNGDGLGGWIDHHLLGDSIEHWGEVQGRYDAGRATKRELVFAAINGSGQTVLLAFTIVDGAALAKGGLTLAGKGITLIKAARAAGKPLFTTEVKSLGKYKLALGIGDRGLGEWAEANGHLSFDTFPLCTKSACASFKGLTELMQGATKISFRLNGLTAKGFITRFLLRPSEWNKISTNRELWHIVTHPRLLGKTKFVK